MNYLKQYLEGTGAEWFWDHRTESAFPLIQTSAVKSRLSKLYSFQSFLPILANLLLWFLFFILFFLLKTIYLIFICLFLALFCFAFFFFLFFQLLLTFNEKNETFPFNLLFPPSLPTPAIVLWLEQEVKDTDLVHYQQLSEAETSTDLAAWENFLLA